MELWDLYDAKRVLMSHMGLHERGKPIPEGCYHIVVHVWVKNTNGEFFITKRSHKKELAPDMWEVTGGSALAGEDSLSAALRETREETGIVHSADSLSLFYSYVRHDNINDVWLIEADFPLTEFVAQEGETCDAAWASGNMIRQMADSGEFWKYSYLDKILCGTRY